MTTFEPLFFRKEDSNSIPDHVKSPIPRRGWRFYMAERMGFEPTVQFDPYTRFPSVRLRPLGHLSKHYLF